MTEVNPRPTFPFSESPEPDRLSHRMIDEAMTATLRESNALRNYADSWTVATSTLRTFNRVLDYPRLEGERTLPVLDVKNLVELLVRHREYAEAARFLRVAFGYTQQEAIIIVGSLVPEPEPVEPATTDDEPTLSLDEAYPPTDRDPRFGPAETDAGQR